MRAKTPKYIRVSNTFESGINGFNMLGSLFLLGGQTDPLHIVNKEYVDIVTSTIDSNNIKSGIISSSRMPELTGDVVTQLGSTTASLLDTGVVAGPIVKPTINTNGRILNGGSLLDSDLPNIEFSKITVNKPTTLDGYGITDAVDTSAESSVTGELILHSNPTSNEHAATKQYVDSIPIPAGGVPVGNIVIKPYSTTPTGFLKCNGGYVDKTTYADLYAIIGDKYNPFNQVNTGKPWSQQYYINTSESNGIDFNWTLHGNLPQPRDNPSVVVTKNRVYLIGGRGSDGNGTATVYTAPINPDGTLGLWTADTPLSDTWWGGQAIVTKNRVYLVGGASGTPATTVYTAPINADGTLGVWTGDATLPIVFYGSEAIITKNRVYLLGSDESWITGHLGFTAPINADGTLGTWVGYNSLPIAISWTKSIVTKNRVYLLGGYTEAGRRSYTVYTAPINVDGTLGQWEISSSQVPNESLPAAVVTTKNAAYMLVVNTTYSQGASSAMLYSKINPDGTLGNWSHATRFPIIINSPEIIVVNNNIYVLGGYSPGINNAIIERIYRSSFDGGVNDYSPYYDGTITSPISSNLFALPDYFLKAKQINSNVDIYIKY